MDAGIPVSHDDPQFVKVLDTCLKMEIAVAQEKLDANTEEVRRLKGMVRTELDNRKQLKARMEQMDRVRTILSETSTRLHANISETSETLGAVRANIDDEYKLIQLRSQEYQDVVARCKESWQAYRAIYEEFPLAKARHAAKINLEKLKIDYMIVTYKIAEMMTVIKQRRQIDWIRTRCKIVEFAAVMVKFSKFEKKVMNLDRNVGYRRKELQSIETQLQILRKQKEDQERVRKQKVLEMAPPKINIPYRQIYHQNRTHTKSKVQSKQFRETFDTDSISINTLVLEELCVSENAVASSDSVNVEPIQGDSAKRIAAETKTANLQVIPAEKTDTRVASIAPRANAEKAALIDNDVEMEKIHLEETKKSQESVKAQPYSGTKENSFKHKAVEDTHEEIEAKRMRLQRAGSAASSNKISAPATVEEVDLVTPPQPGPKITKIETVNYNIAPIKSMPKYVQRPNIMATNMPSPVHEYCESNMSNMSSIDQDFMSKGPQSLFDGSLCNYKLSMNSNISSVCMAQDAQVSPPRYANLQQDNKNQESGNILPFLFENFTQKKEKMENDFTLF